VAWFPLVGALVGLATAAVHGLGLRWWPAPVAGVVAVAFGLMLTGGFHEDGASDAADGLGAGGSPERVVEIMRDSRIGAYGASALALALMLRFAALSAALGLGVGAAAAALVAVSAISRAGALTPLAALRPARADGLGAAAALGTSACARAWGVGLVIVALTAAPVFGVGRSAASAAGAVIGAAAMTALAARRIGGQTGDVAGAAQQWAELGAWAGLLIASSPA
jgi:adenosylcobinamide-GDP ribazoletransferase